MNDQAKENTTPEKTDAEICTGVKRSDVIQYLYAEAWEAQHPHIVRNLLHLTADYLKHGLD